MTKVMFTMHDGKEIVVEIEKYNAQLIADKINNKRDGEEIVVFGEKGFNKYAVKYFEPVID